MQRLKDGYADSKKFIDVMSGRKRRNSLLDLNVNGAWVDGVTCVCEVFLNHFKNHFKSVNLVRRSIENLYFLSLISNEAYMLGEHLVRRKGQNKLFEIVIVLKSKVLT